MPYIAAPSQKAALEAWGSERDLFSAGAAEPIDDPELMREPLANPGKVIRRARGTVAEHIAALAEGHTAPPPQIGATDGQGSRAHRRRRAKSAPARLSRSRGQDRQPLGRAETELAESGPERHRGEIAALARRAGRNSTRERRKIEAAQERERQKIERRIESARDKYDRAMRAWRES